jgi:AcrR family transcriptional regulator
VPDLRERHRRRREAAIINAAIELIERNGYRNTSIEEIAEKAEVGPATVYNYYGSKSGLLLAIFHAITERFLANGSAVIDELPSDPVEAVYKLVENSIGDVGGSYSKHLISEMMVAVMVEQRSVRNEVIGLDYSIIGKLSELLSLLQEKGTIRPEILPEDGAFVIYSLIMTDLMAYLMEEDMSFSECLRLIKHHIGLAFRGLS